VEIKAKYLGFFRQIYYFLFSLILGSTKGAIQARSFDIRDSIRDSSDRPQEISLVDLQPFFID